MLKSTTVNVSTGEITKEYFSQEEWDALQQTWLAQQEAEASASPPPPTKEELFAKLQALQAQIAALP